jgi:hypothetical protein
MSCWSKKWWKIIIFHHFFTKNHDFSCKNHVKNDHFWHDTHIYPRNHNYFFMKKSWLFMIFSCKNHHFLMKKWPKMTKMTPPWGVKTVISGVFLIYNMQKCHHMLTWVMAMTILAKNPKTGPRYSSISAFLENDHFGPKIVATPQNVKKMTILLYVLECYLQQWHPRCHFRPYPIFSCFRPKIDQKWPFLAKTHILTRENRPFFIDFWSKMTKNHVKSMIFDQKYTKSNTHRYYTREFVVTISCFFDKNDMIFHVKNIIFDIMTNIIMASCGYIGLCFSHKSVLQLFMIDFHQNRRYAHINQGGRFFPLPKMMTFHQFSSFFMKNAKNDENHCWY